MKESIKNKQTRAGRRQKRVRVKLHGSSSRPRLSVFISNIHMYAQLIDDTAGKTLAHVSDQAVGTRVSHVTVLRAHDLGKKIAELARAKGIQTVVFDRGRYRYHGRVKAFTDGAREGGLTF